MDLMSSRHQLAHPGATGSWQARLRNVPPEEWPKVYNSSKLEYRSGDQFMLAALKPFAVGKNMSHPVRDAGKGYLTHEILHRLHWSVFDNFNTIDVADGLDEKGVEIRSPLSSHEVANELIYQQPFYKLRIFSANLDTIAGTMIEASIRSPAPSAQITTDTPMTISG